jgi:hypothetical protein
MVDDGSEKFTIQKGDGKMTARNHKLSRSVGLLAVFLSALLITGATVRASDADPDGKNATPTQNNPESGYKRTTPLTAKESAAQAKSNMNALLNKALEQNPAIVSAQAKLALAQAELRAAQIEVSSRIISIIADQETQKEKIAMAERKAELIRRVGTEEEYAAASGAVIEEKAKLARLENDLNALTGEIPTGSAFVAVGGGFARVQEIGSQSTINWNSSASESKCQLRESKFIAIQYPSGPFVEKILQSLDCSIDVDLSDTMIKDVLKQFKEKSKGIEFEADERGLGEIGLSPDCALSLNMHGKPLRMVLQALEDRTDGLKFVVRDYGILITSREIAKAQGYVSVVDFIEQEKLKKARNSTSENEQRIMQKLDDIQMKQSEQDELRGMQSLMEEAKKASESTKADK